MQNETNTPPEENTPENTPENIPPVSNEMTPEELAEAQEYGRVELRCTVADRVIDLVFLLVATFVISVPLSNAMDRCPVIGPYWTLRVLTMFLIIIGLHFLVSFPLSYYSGHVVEHRFGLSRLTFGGWLWRWAKRAVLAIGFGLLMYLGLFWLIHWTGAWWWLVAAGAFFVISVILGQLAPVLIMPLFYKIEKLDRADLNERMKKLSEGTGLSIEGVYRLDLSEETAKANAMLAGLGSTRRVLLGDTLLDGFTLDEIEIVFAHEIGHHVFRHIRKMILQGLVYSAVGFWLCDLGLNAWASAQGTTLDYAAVPAYMVPMFMLVMFLFANLVGPLQNITSRRYERQCDRYALQRTGNREAYRAAFQKLARLNKDDPNPSPIEVFLFHSHPPISERLKMADEV